MKPNNAFLNEAKVKSDKSDKEKYALYYSLDVNKKKCLDATNYWRVMSGLKEIPVPESDKNYHNYFDKRCYDLCEQYQKMKKDKDSFFKTLTVNKKVEVKIVVVEEVKEAEVKIEQKVEIAKKVEVVEVKVEQKVVEKITEKPIDKIVEKPIDKPITKTKKKEINNNQQQSSLF
jgi:hypothetical protein